MWYHSFGKVLALVILVFILLTGLLFGLLVFAQYRNLQKPVTQNTNTITNNNLYVAPDADDDPSLGSPAAKVTIIAFEDFQCPFCKEAEAALTTTLNKYSNDIYFVYRDFPLYTIHLQGRAAAQAGECADEQGQFWVWHDIAYANQSALTQAPLIFSTWAQQAGLDVTKFNTCITNDTYKNEVQKDIDEGFLAGVSATPTWFVNGKKYEGVLTEQQWSDIIEAAIIQP
ncbi:MAG: thioredoxin domain-containing protein [Patescibacteria group bacterium]|jgi:protein-disulfide isomerase